MFLELQNLKDTTEDNPFVAQSTVAQDYKPRLQDTVIIHILVQLLLTFFIYLLSYHQKYFENDMYKNQSLFATNTL